MHHDNRNYYLPLFSITGVSSINTWDVQIQAQAAPGSEAQLLFGILAQLFFRQTLAFTGYDDGGGRLR